MQGCCTSLRGRSPAVLPAAVGALLLPSLGPGVSEEDGNRRSLRAEEEKGAHEKPCLAL